MVGDGVGEGDEAVDADCTPPQPMIRARRGTLKKAHRTRLKALAPHESFEREKGCPVGLRIHGFLTEKPLTLALWN